MENHNGVNNKEETNQIIIKKILLKSLTNKDMR